MKMTHLQKESGNKKAEYGRVQLQLFNSSWKHVHGITANVLEGLIRGITNTFQQDVNTRIKALQIIGIFTVLQEPAV